MATHCLFIIHSNAFFSSPFLCDVPSALSDLPNGGCKNGRYRFSGALALSLSLSLVVTVRKEPYNFNALSLGMYASQREEHFS